MIKPLNDDLTTMYYRAGLTMMNVDRRTAILTFGAFEVDLRAGELRERGRRTKLQDKPFQALAMLVKRPGEVVTREELREGLWPSDTFVDFDANLNTAIRRLREALGDTAEKPRYIETLPKRGYRFLVPVKTQNSAPSPASVIDSGAIASSKKSARLARYAAALSLVIFFIGLSLKWRSTHRQQANQNPRRVMLAILPFQNLSGRADEEFVSDGLTEEMTTQVGRLDPSHLGVIARTSVTRFKASKEDVHRIGQDLGVDYVLESSVRRDADQLFVTAQLIRVSDQTHVWAESYARPFGEVFAVQRDVARGIAQCLALKLLPGEEMALARAATINTAAYEDYLRARYEWSLGTETGFRTALAAFEESVKKDPNYAVAYAGIARTYVSLGDYHFEAPDVAEHEAERAIERGMSADNTIPELYLMHAVALDRANPKPAGIEEAYRHALDLDPNYAEAHEDFALYLRGQKRFSEAVEEARRGLDLDNASPMANVCAGWAFLSAGRDKDASAVLQKALTLSPDYPSALYFLAKIDEQRGHRDQAVADLQRAVVSSGRTPKYLHALGMLYADVGKKNEARELLEELQRQSKVRFVDSVYVTNLRAKLGEVSP